MLLFRCMEIIACVLSAGIYSLTRLAGLPFSQSLSIGAGGPELEATAFTLQDFIEACYELFIKMTGILTHFIPLAVLCSIWSLMLTTGTSLLLSLLGVLVIVFFGMVALMCIDCVRLRIVGLSPVRFIKKYSPAMAHVFTTTSSSISLPENMKAAKGMGVPEKVYSLALRQRRWLASSASTP